MATRRSKRAAGVMLANNFDDFVAHGRHEGLLAARADLEAKYADVTCKFSIFDLPPELRLRIYAYAMADIRRDRLLDLPAPVLAMVSKQVRAEALPIFFSECTFKLSTVSNYGYKAELDTLLANGELEELLTVPRSHASYRRASVNVTFESGKIYEKLGRRMERRMSRKAWFQRVQEEEGIAVAFRNIDMRILCPPEVSGMSIRVPIATKSRPRFTYTDPQHIAWDVPGYNSVDLPALKLLRENAEAVASEIATAREVFVGFTPEDLGAIAMAFKYWPVEDSQQSTGL